MSDFNIEIINPQNNTIAIENILNDNIKNLDIITENTAEIAIENSLNNDITNLDIVVADNTTLDIVNTEKILPSDFPDTYPFTSVIGDVPYTRVSGLTENTQDIIGSSLSGISGINISYNDNSGFTTISLSDPIINVVDIVDFNSGVSGLLPVINITAGNNISISKNSGTFTISSTATNNLGSSTGNSVTAGVGVTISNSGINRLLVNDGSSSGIVAQENLTFNGSLFNVSGSGIFANNITASGFIRSGGTSSQFLKADGSIDNATYTTNLGTVTSVAALTLGSTGTDVSSSVSNGSSTPVIILNIPTASGTARGLLSSTDWSTFNNKQPSGSYALSSHIHTSSDITNFNTSVDSRITNANLQPSGNYALSSHTHTTSQIADFNTSVDGRITNANLQPSGNYSIFGHTHTISNITGLQTELDNKQASGNYSLAGHSHNVSDITSLQTTLDSKQPSGSYALSSHTHSSSNITDFNSSVSGLLTVKNITGSGFVNISSATGNYTISVTGLQPSGNYSSVGHTHTMSDIISLQTTLDGKQASGNYAPSSHTHSSSSITDFNSSVSGLFPKGTVNYIPKFGNGGSGLNNSVIVQSGNFIGIGINPEEGINLKASTITASNVNFNTEGEVKIKSSRLWDGTVAGIDIDTVFGYANFYDQLFINSFPYDPIVNISGNLNINGTNVSVSGHSHTASNITNFNSSVSGLLPVVSIVGGSNVSVTNANSVFTINSTQSYSRGWFLS